MSPEQSLGKSVDARSDQYSLGCVIFELLTGTTPFDTSGSLQAMMAHVQEQAPTLKKASRKDFPAHVEKSVARMLAKEPEDRFADVEEARAAFLGEKEFSAPSRAKTSSKRNKSKAPFEISTRSWIVVGISAASLVIGFISFGLLKTPPAEKPRLASKASEKLAPPPSGKPAERQVAASSLTNMSEADLRKVKEADLQFNENYFSGSSPYLEIEGPRSEICYLSDNSLKELPAIGKHLSRINSRRARI